jgi:hypothetical protein
MQAGISLHPVPLYNPQHRQVLVAVGMHFPSPAQYLPRHFIYLAWIKGGNPASRSIKSVTGLEKSVIWGTRNLQEEHVIPNFIQNL